MDATQAAGLCLIAFVLSEVFLRRGATAKSLKPTRTDRGTTLLLSACYMAVVGILFFPNLPGTVLPTAVAWVGVGAACAGLPPALVGHDRPGAVLHPDADGHVGPARRRPRPVPVGPTSRQQIIVRTTVVRPTILTA